MQQAYLPVPDENGAGLAAWLKSRGCGKLFVVCDPSIRFLRMDGTLNGLEARFGIRVTRFDRFEPNPRYESAREGVHLFREAGCDAVMGIGGGSAMDVAKCIKLWACEEEGETWLRRPVPVNGVPLIAMPTTAGTGSEATRYAVVYENGVKQSVTDDSIIPTAVLLDPSVLDTLPAYQRRATMFDALSHAVESFWSVHSTEESMALSERAVRDILACREGYLANRPEGNAAMLQAAHTAGQAINITQTTAGHAMCYKLTSLFGAAHGHAAALVNRRLWPWMTQHADRCTDPRGAEHLKAVLRRMAACMGCEDSTAGALRFAELFDEAGLTVPEATEQQIDELCATVNPDRLKNHPVRLEADDIRELYRLILRK